MEIVLGMYRLRDPGGTEHYTLVTAEHLQKLGHEVTVFTEEAGPMAELARARGVRVAESEEELPRTVDVVYAQESITTYRLAARYRQAPLVVATHAHDYDLSVPPQLPGLVSAVVVTHDRVGRRAAAFAADAELVRLRQPVDVARFEPRGSLREPPRRLLTLGNYLNGDRARVIDDACSKLGIEVVRVGALHGGVLEADRVLNDADIVVGKARVIVEAMACGRAAYVFDTFGSDGWVTPETYARLEPDNFSGQTGSPPVDVQRLRSDLELYRPEMGAANRELAVVNHSASKHAVELVELFERLAPRTTPQTAPLRELARLVRVQWGIEERALTAAAEARRLRDENQRLHERVLELEPAAASAPELERSARKAHQAVRDLLAQRRVRLGMALARPLDVLRRLRR
jgi:hypothetical protein